MVGEIKVLDANLTGVYVCEIQAQRKFNYPIQQFCLPSKRNIFMNALIPKPNELNTFSLKAEYWGKKIISQKTILEAFYERMLY